MSRQPKKSAHIVRALVLAALLLGTAGLVRLLAPAYIGPELARRALGVLMGCIVIAYANAVPKVLVPLDRLTCDPATDQALRRFCGWSVSLGGVGYVLAWLAAPIAWAIPLAASALGLALGAFVLRLGWSRLRRR